jgi:formate-dependent nitrite reductase cytochrome c552 subunit
MFWLSKFLPAGAFYRQFQPFSRSFQTENLKYKIRSATEFDIEQINDCNYRNLPEHYTHDFYSAQITRFPTLSLVAETEEDAKLVILTQGYAESRFYFCFRLGIVWEE